MAPTNCHGGADCGGLSQQRAAANAKRAGRRGIGRDVDAQHAAASNQWPGERTNFAFGCPRYRARAQATLRSHPRAAKLDFSARSSTPRFHVIDRASGQVLQSFRVAHGHGSEGMRDDGYAEVFSNAHGSNASSLRPAPNRRDISQRLVPWSFNAPGRSVAHDSNARSRFIVIHEAGYMDPESWM